jgi:hypothetical protein
MRRNPYLANDVFPKFPPWGIPGPSQLPDGNVWDGFMLPPRQYNLSSSSSSKDPRHIFYGLQAGFLSVVKNPRLRLPACGRKIFPTLSTANFGIRGIATCPFCEKVAEKCHKRNEWVRQVRTVQVRRLDEPNVDD